jgi:transcriptional regulator with XRE-family HTH domain
MFREARGLSQTALAARLGVSQGEVSNWELGKRQITLDRLATFARVLDCSIADLLTDEDNPARLSSQDAILVESFRAVPLDARPYVLSMVRSLSAPADIASAA